MQLQHPCAAHCSCLSSSTSRSSTGIQVQPSVSGNIPQNIPPRLLHGGCTCCTGLASCCSMRQLLFWPAFASGSFTLSACCVHFMSSKHGTRMARPRSSGQRSMASWRRSFMQRPGKMSASLSLHLCSAIRSHSQLQSKALSGQVVLSRMNVSVDRSSKALSTCRPSH